MEGGAGASAAPALEPACRDDIDRLLLRSSPFGNETGTLPNGEFTPGPQAREALSRARVLVIGAGALGSEMLKNLAMSGVKDIHIIDMDTIELTNLNRQFLFRTKDIGRHKAVVAAEFVAARVPGVKVTPHTCAIQDKPAEFYKQFSVVLGGLDNIGARRWINSLLCSFVEVDEDGDLVDPSQIVPYIDGGTEGFKGQSRLVLPRITPCFECVMYTFPPVKTFAFCTVAATPRKPEHCIAFAMMDSWPKAFPDRKFDTDSPEDMRWIHERASEYAASKRIEGVTYALTLGVVKNIIPAVASTNALIAAECVLEAVKVISYASQSLNSSWNFAGSERVSGATETLERLPDCLACNTAVRRFTLPGGTLLKDFIRMLKEDAKLQLADPYLRATTGDNLYMGQPKQLRELTAPNLEKPLSALVTSGQEVVVTDSMFPLGVALSVFIHLE